MGRYAMCLITSLIDVSDYTVEIILSSQLNLHEHDKQELEALWPTASFRYLDLWHSKKHTIAQAAAHNKRVLSQYTETLSQAKETVYYFIPSLFQEPVVSAFPDNVFAKVALFHDLIPYLYHLRYQPVMRWPEYLQRFRFVFEADLVCTNSQTVADDLHMYLGVSRQKLRRIDGAAIHTDASVEKPPLAAVDNPFILLNTSDDPRKNNLRAVLGFEEFRVSGHKDYWLVLTSTISPREQEHLRRFSNHLLFTGNLAEKQLNWLYEHCELVLFVPESEGLGLPVLEAVDAHKKVVCSAIPVLQEINPKMDAFYYCDHENSYSIAKALERAVAPGAKINESAYKQVRSYYSWGKTAERMYNALQDFTPKSVVKKRRIAIFMAAPEGLSGVGLTGAALHPVLADVFEIDYYIESGLSNAKIRPNYLQYIAPCYPAESFSVQAYAQYDAVIYHLGNGEYHLNSIQNALYLPGYIIVHDTNLKEAYRVLSEVGMMAPERLRLEEAIDAKAGATSSNYYSSLANRQLGIITHSEYAKNAMQQLLDVPVNIIKTNLPTNVPVLTNIRGLDKIVIGLAGAIADVKGIDIIEAIAENTDFKDCDINLFGFNHASPEKIEKLNSYDNVVVATNVTDYDFQTNIRNLHIFVNYRLIYKGETSNTTLESMRQGVVTIVRDVGWYSELPDDAVIKVNSPEQVFDRLRELVKHPEQMIAIGKRAKAYVQKHFTQEQYAAALENIFAQEAAANPNFQIAKAIRAGEVKTAGQLISLREGSHE